MLIEINHYNSLFKYRLFISQLVGPILRSGKQIFKRVLTHYHLLGKVKYSVHEAIFNLIFLRVLQT